MYTGDLVFALLKDCFGTCILRCRVLSLGFKPLVIIYAGLFGLWARFGGVCVIVGGSLILLEVHPMVSGFVDASCVRGEGVAVYPKICEVDLLVVF